jgi:hypothetical protein
MARNRPLSGDVPTVIATSPQATSVNGQIQTPQTMGGGRVYFVSYDAAITLPANLRGPVTSPVPRARIDIVDRPLRVGLTTYAGRDPYEMTVPITLGRVGGGSIEKDISQLTALALPKGKAADSIDGLPRVLLVGPTPYPAQVWWVSEIAEVPERLEYTADGYRCRFAADVTLIEHTEQQLLAVGATVGSTQTAVMHAGESLTDLARRLFPGHPEKAKGIASKNNLKAGYVARADVTVKLP